MGCTLEKECMNKIKKLNLHLKLQTDLKITYASFDFLLHVSARDLLTGLLFFLLRTEDIGSKLDTGPKYHDSKQL